jgi:hypothetical protein
VCATAGGEVNDETAMGAGTMGRLTMSLLLQVGEVNDETAMGAGTVGRLTMSLPWVQGG